MSSVANATRLRRQSHATNTTARSTHTSTIYQVLPLVCVSTVGDVSVADTAPPCRARVAGMSRKTVLASTAHNAMMRKHNTKLTSFAYVSC